MTNAEKIENENRIVLDAISQKRPRRFSDVQAEIAQKLAASGIAVSHVPSLRVVDRALQRLKRAGKIRIIRGVKGGWVRT